GGEPLGALPGRDEGSSAALREQRLPRTRAPLCLENAAPGGSLRIRHPSGAATGDGDRRAPTHGGGGGNPGVTALLLGLLFASTAIYLVAAPVPRSGRPPEWGRGA